MQRTTLPSEQPRLSTLLQAGLVWEWGKQSYDKSSVQELGAWRKRVKVRVASR